MGVFEMNLIEALLMWAHSLEGWFSLHDVIMRSGNSSDNVMRRSAWVNIRCGDKEAELILWESGEAEFGSSGGREGVTEEHYDLGNISDLGPVLRRLLVAID
jgi:hypothetical protein